MKLLAKFVKMYLSPNTCSENCPGARILKFGKSIFDYDSQIECKNSIPIPIRLNAALLKDESDNPAGGVITFRDLSSKKNRSIVKRRIQTFMQRFLIPKL